MSCSNVVISSNYGPLIINVNDQVIANNVIRDGYFAIHDIQLIKLLIDELNKIYPEIVFYDVGSNIGTHTLAIAKIYQDKVKIRSFEAQRQIFNMLCGNMAINGIRNAYCYNNAVSNINDVDINILLPDYDSLNNFGGIELDVPLRSDNLNVRKPGLEKIKTITIDSFEEQVGFIKIDVEGMEDKVLMGAKKTIEQYRPICFVELLKTDIRFIFDFFKNRNYRGYRKEENLVAIPLDFNIRIKGLVELF
ncbi:MAG: FkbM family methyltransferase [Chlorobiaceae bacterium]